ncbi:hypothetical protein C1N80_06335 [Brachybacterium sp. SGAir0954]|uniref:hypothetical protein n=1 Tax=Brachybacterium sp. SGAir0954 TaxID=2571029 RepID=UPI0010CCB977|nr:hypothetical protein [Brachybacterium sp. SGAir0954]QCR53238.1 hypothetical protein C1N80_06335 [Brachybacterium sp. SGAir0954]
MTLTFNEASHRYRLDGKPVTGATTIIGGGIPKPALAYWAANQAAEAAAEWAQSFRELPPSEAAWNLANIDRDDLYEQWRKAPWKKRDEAAVRGTAVHALAERVVHGEDVDVPDTLLGHVEGYVDFLDAWDVTPLLTEKSVANRTHWYAGRFDLIASVPSLHDGAPIEIDLKTSTGVYPDTAIQTAAYARAEFWVDDTDPDTEHPLPDIAATYVAHVTGTGTRLYELSPDREHIDQSFTAFLAALAVKNRWNPKTLKEVTR